MLSSLSSERTLPPRSDIRKLAALSETEKALAAIDRCEHPSTQYRLLAGSLHLILRSAVNTRRAKEWYRLERSQWENGATQESPGVRLIAVGLLSARTAHAEDTNPGRAAYLKYCSAGR
jgi:hypothetical protein